MKKTDQTPFITEYSRVLDQCHGKRPDKLWFATWMASKSPYSGFPKSFAFHWENKDKSALESGPNSLFSLVKMGKTLVGLIFKTLHSKWHFRVPLQKLSREKKPLSVVRTFSYAADHSKPDPFWTDLLTALTQDQTSSLLVIYEPMFPFSQCKNAYNPKLNNIPYFAFLSPVGLIKNYFALCFEALFNSSAFDNELLNSSYKSDLLHPSSLVSLAFFDCFKDVFKTYEIKRLFITYENNPWEKMVYLAREKSKKSFPVIGFQHAAIPKDATNYSLSEYEAKKKFFPDTIMTVGLYTKELLASYPHYKNAHLKVGCALRHKYLESIPKAKSPLKNTAQILVVLDGTDDTIHLLNLIIDYVKENFKGNIRLREHPNMPLSLFAPGFSSDIIQISDLKKQTLQEELERASLVIYSGSTVCIEALKLGKAVINYNFSLFNYDPLFAFDGLKWTVQNSSELKAAVNSFTELSALEIEKKQSLGYSFAEEYFFPCTNENIHKFLED